jgi:Tfp pilus assembly protein FimV
MSFKRKADQAHLNAAPDIVPLPASNTPQGQRVDLIFAVEESVRQRIADPAGINDQQLANSHQNLFDDGALQSPVLQAIAQLPAQVQALAQLPAQVQGLTAQVQGLTTQVQGLSAQVQTLQNNMDPARQNALLLNSRAINPDSIIQNVPRLTDLTLAPNFPATLADFNNMNGNQVNGLLEFHGVPTNGTVVDRRRRLASVLYLQHV